MKTRRMFIDGKEIVQTFWDANQNVMCVVTEDKKKIGLTNQEQDWLHECCDEFYDSRGQTIEYNRFKVSW